MKRKNIYAKELYNKKYKPRIIKPKKVKAVLKEKKIKLKSSAYLLNYFR